MTRDEAGQRWVSWRQASALTGIPVPTIEHAVRVGRIGRRSSHGSRPTLDLASVEEWVASYARQAASPVEGRTSGTDVKRKVRPFRKSVDRQWLSAVEAAALMDVGEDTVRRMARSGKLTSLRDERWLVHRDAVTAYLAEEAKWITWVQAKEIIGAPRHVVESWIRDGRLRTRKVARAKPSVERLSAEAMALEWQGIAAERDAARRRRQAAKNRSLPPDDGQEWLSTRQAAELLGCSAGWVCQRVVAETLPGIRRGHRLWLRRVDVDRARLAKDFARSPAPE